MCAELLLICKAYSPLGLTEQGAQFGPKHDDALCNMYSLHCIVLCLLMPVDLSYFTSTLSWLHTSMQHRCTRFVQQLDECTETVQITAVVAVGLVEGTTHVNWPKVSQILKWWVLSVIPVFLATAAFFGQGIASPRLSQLT